MSALERLAVGMLLAVALVVAAFFGVRHYGIEQRQVGWNAAVTAGKEQREAEAAAALAIESGLRTRLLEQDTTAHRKEQEHASELEAAQRRVRAGVDSLRCPAAGPVPDAAAADDRATAAGSAADREGLAIVPEVAAEILGDGADVAGLVRRYQRLVERFEACRALNAK